MHPLFKIHIKYIYKCQKIQIKMPRVYLDMIHAYKVVSAKTDMFCALCKKDKFLVLKKSISRSIVCLFYIGYKNCRFYVKLDAQT
jgi:hypothetical protein